MRILLILLLLIISGMAFAEDVSFEMPDDLDKGSENESNFWFPTFGGYLNKEVYCELSGGFLLGPWVRDFEHIDDHGHGLLLQGTVSLRSIKTSIGYGYSGGFMSFYIKYSYLNPWKDTDILDADVGYRGIEFEGTIPLVIGLRINIGYFTDPLTDDKFYMVSIGAGL